jgi:hypothetical protein
VNPRLVPGWADAEAVAAGFTAKPGVHYTGLYFNGNGLDRALAFKDKLSISGSISLTASEGFTKKNLHRTHAENLEAMKRTGGTAHRQGNSGDPRRRHGGVRLQLPGRHSAGPGGEDAG